MVKLYYKEIKWLVPVTAGDINQPINQAANQLLIYEATTLIKSVLQRSV